MESLKPLLINAKTAAKLLGIGLSAFYELRRNRKIPSSINMPLNKSLWDYEKLCFWVRVNCPNEEKFNKLLKSIYKKENDKARELLTDSYVKMAICQGSILSSKDIPKELVKLKRQYLKLYREIKERGKNNGQKGNQGVSQESRRCVG